MKMGKNSNNKPTRTKYPSYIYLYARLAPYITECLPNEGGNTGLTSHHIPTKINKTKMENKDNKLTRLNGLSCLHTRLTSHQPECQP